MRESMKSLVTGAARGAVNGALIGLANANADQWSLSRSCCSLIVVFKLVAFILHNTGKSK